MIRNESSSRKTFLVFDYMFLAVVALLCLLPLIHVFALSLSSSAAATAGEVKLWPVDFTWSSYRYVAGKPEFIKALTISVKRVALGVPINMFLTILVAYPLSREINTFRFRKIYAWLFVITILFNGGLIPWYMTIFKTGLIDRIWALIIPSAVPVFNVIILMNFFKELPKEIEESAFIDGASHWLSLWKICVPLSKPALATLILFCTVGHWNSWFDGLILMNRPEKYPLQSYLQTVVVQRDLTRIQSKDISTLAEVSERTSKAAQIFLGAVPILLVYPFLQKYFMKGIILGSVKG